MTTEFGIDSFRNSLSTHEKAIGRPMKPGRYKSQSRGVAESCFDVTTQLSDDIDTHERVLWCSLAGSFLVYLYNRERIIIRLVL